MPQSSCARPNHWMSIWHSHGHTCRSARTHVVAYTGSAQRDHSSILRGSYEFVSMFLNTQQCFSPTSFIGGLQKSSKKSRRYQYSTLKSIQHCQVSLCRGWDTVIPVVKKNAVWPLQSVASVSPFMSSNCFLCCILCLLISCDSVQNEQGLYILGTGLGTSCQTGPIHPTKSYMPYGSTSTS